jgi:hypothetical protein
VAKVTSFLVVALLVVAVTGAANASSAVSSARGWWWTPEFAEWSLSAKPGTKDVACIGVGKAGFPLKGAASVSPDGELGYGAKWGLGATQVPKFRRFRCLIEISRPGTRPRWSVIDLIPQGRLREQRLLIPVATGIGTRAKR